LRVCSKKINLSNNKYYLEKTKLDRKVFKDNVKYLDDKSNLTEKNYSRNVVFYSPKGSFTKSEIKELIERFREWQSICKISRNIKRNEKSIKRYLINVGLIKKKICSENLINAGLYNPKLSFKIFFKVFFLY